MTLAETITSAIVAMASLSLPVILGFLLYSTLHIRKDLNREIQSLRKDMNEDMQNLRQDMHQDISKVNSRLGRIEGRLFGIDTPAAG